MGSLRLEQVCKGAQLPDAATKSPVPLGPSESVELFEFLENSRVAERLLPKVPKNPRGIKRRLTISPVAQQRLHYAYQGFATRRLDLSTVSNLIQGPIRPRPGDLVLARVERLRYHRRIELVNGRKANLHTGDEIIVAYGNRYATDQYEGLTPYDLGPTNLIATGGVAATMVARNSAMPSATEIVPIGLLGNDRGDPINLRDLALTPVRADRPRPSTIAVLGTSMNSGKTTACKSLIRGLRAAGKRVAGLKMTGTGSGGDYWAMIDAGAQVVADFSDAGYSATYKVSLEELETILVDLLSHATSEGADVAVIEVADGIFQSQNRELIRSCVFRAAVDRVVFAAGDSLGAAQGLATLREIGLPVVALSGRITMSSLALRELEQPMQIGILSKRELETPHIAIKEVLEAPVEGLMIANGPAARDQSVFNWGVR